MYEIYLALLLFGNNACHANVTCPQNSAQCEFKVKAPCALTLPECLEATLVTARGRHPVLGCANKPNPKSGDAEIE